MNSTEAKWVYDRYQSKPDRVLDLMDKLKFKRDYVINECIFQIKIAEMILFEEYVSLKSGILKKIKEDI